MGVVYAAFDSELRRNVALKLMRSNDERASERLVREARVMAQVSHPNVVAVYDVGTCEGRVFIAMELVCGDNLAEWLSAKPHSYKDVVAAFLEAGRGLAAAHAVGVIHRDFKPANILVSPTGRVCVTDFGMARPVSTGDANDLVCEGAAPSPSTLAHSFSTLTATGAVVGTPAYMSPEQFLGQPADARSDQFSFCVALYEALYGERPFAGRGVRGLSDAVSRGTIRSAPRGSKVPGAMRAVVLRGLRPSATERYPSMQALLDALLRFSATPPALVRPRRTGVAAVVLASAMVVGTLALSRHLPLPAGRPTPGGIAGTADPTTAVTDVRAAMPSLPLVAFSGATRSPMPAATKSVGRLPPARPPAPTAKAARAARGHMASMPADDTGLKSFDELTSAEHNR
jgi:serine/threonine protein kinase